MTALEKFYDPISPESDCGEDVTYNPAYQELEKLLLGKPETQFSPGEPPNWSEIRTRSLELLGVSKNLRVVLTLCAALTRLEGFAGFRDGMTLLRVLVEKYWAGLYPRLDPEDHNDPTERVNIVGSLAVPLGTLGDQLKFLEALRSWPLCDTSRGRYSLEDIANSRAGVKSTAKKTVPAPSDIEAAFRDSDPVALRAADATIAETITQTQQLEQLLEGLVGGDKARDFGPLVTTLAEIRKALTPYLAVAEAAAGETPVVASEAAAEAPAAAGPRSSGLSGSVESRQQVVQALDLVCNYYARHEPSSPVPLLLQRARRLVDLDFLGIVADLSPETLDKVRFAAGIPQT